MRSEIFRQLDEVRDSLPCSFHMKGELIKFFEATLSLLIPPSTEQRALEHKSTVIDIGSQLLPSNQFEEFLATLPATQLLIVSDAETILREDPAAQSLEEVLLCYPGFLATAAHRVAHSLYLLGYTLYARIISEHMHSRTGIDIHPGAKIGPRFCIDHGTGIVIGETCELGSDIKLFQGVTLGALNVKKEMASTKRHPTLCDSVVIYANATLLGPITVGAGSIIGANVWLNRSVSENSKISKATLQD